ncbi:hypothetical protein OAH87_05050 [Marinomonas sp.]|nr:hypothetical protein [Marinomonas sp.]MDB4837818.1 hypothetical protein [Marinomonas sp.]
MTTKHKILIHLVVAALAVYVSYKFSFSFAKENLLTLVDKLVSVSAVIFAIMGVWFSVTKLEIEQKVNYCAQNGNGSGADQAIERARFLVIPMTTSALTLLFSLLFYLGYFLFPMFDLSESILSCAKGVAFGIVMFSYIMIAFNTVPVFLSGGLFLLDLMDIRNRELRRRNQHGEEINDDS